MAKGIEQARNLGPVTGADLRLVGISTVEELMAVGWEDAWTRLCHHSRGYTHKICGYALCGAIEDVDWRKLTARQKEDVTRVQRRIQRDLRNLA